MLFRCCRSFVPVLPECYSGSAGISIIRSFQTSYHSPRRCIYRQDRAESRPLSIWCRISCRSHWNAASSIESVSIINFCFCLQIKIKFPNYKPVGIKTEMDISECSLIGWEIGWEISRFGAYLPAFILLIHSEMCRCWKIWQIFSSTRFYTYWGIFFNFLSFIHRNILILCKLIDFVYSYT